MPLLKNQRHELFVHGLAKGKTADQAYKDAGYTPSRQNAHHLTTKHYIIERLAELQAKTAQRTQVTLESLVEQLRKDRDFARERGQAGAAIAATMGLAKLTGHLVDKAAVEVNHRFADLTDAELYSELVALLNDVRPVDGTAH